MKEVRGPFGEKRMEEAWHGVEFFFAMDKLSHY